MIKEKKNDFMYGATISIDVVRIEVFSTSGLATPFYWVKDKDGVIRQFGGAIMGRLAEMDDPIWEARSEENFIYNIYPSIERGESITDYDYTRAVHKQVADSGMLENISTRVDIFTNGEMQKYCIAGSNFFYRKTEDGGFTMILDGVEMERMGILNKEE